MLSDEDYGKAIEIATIQREANAKIGIVKAGSKAAYKKQKQAEKAEVEATKAEIEDEKALDELSQELLDDVSSK